MGDASRQSARTIRDELRELVTKLRTLPTEGAQKYAELRTLPTEGAQKYAVHGRQVIWRRLMSKTRHHVYFRLNDRGTEIEVLTVWNAQGGESPHFSF